MADEEDIARAREVAVLGAKFDIFTQQQREYNDAIKTKLMGLNGDNGLQGDLREVRHWRRTHEQEHLHVDARLDAIDTKLAAPLKKAEERREFYWREFMVKTMLPVLIAIGLEKLFEFIMFHK